MAPLLTPMLKIITNLSPVGIFCLIMACVFIIIFGIVWSEFIKLRHDLGIIKKRMSEGTITDILLTERKTNGYKAFIKFTNLFDEIRN